VSDDFQAERVIARAIAGEQLSRTELQLLAKAVEFQTAALEKHRHAVEHVLNQAQRDPKGLGYYVGPYTRSFELLCEAEAHYLSRDVADVTRERGKRAPAT
jgi:hypothetical protein